MADLVREAVGEARLARRLRTAIAARLDDGESLDSVERELIEPSPLSEEQQSALWLYGWSLCELRRRHVGLDALDVLARDGRAATGRRGCSRATGAGSRCRT